jgi:hypothetical protein
MAQARAQEASRKAVLAWMEETGRGYKAAARHFGVPAKTVRQWARVGRDPGVHAGDGPAGEFVLVPHESAAAAVAKLEPGGWVCGLTKGQFSLLDLLQAVLQVTGPADVVLSTWTTGIRDAESAAWLIESGAIRSFSILTDRSFPQRQPAYCRRLLELFGEESMVCTNTHAKFVMVKAGDWRVVLRSSMNLNRNPRFEQFDINDDPDLYAYFEAFVADVRANHQTGAVSARDIVDEAWARVMREEGPEALQLPQRARRSQAAAPGEREAMEPERYLEMTEVERTRAQVRQLLEDIEFYRLSPGAGQAVASLRRQLSQATEQLSAIEKPEAEFDEWDATQVAERVVAVMRDPEVAAEVERLQRRDT